MLLNSKLVIPATVAALVILALVGGGYLYYQYQKPNTASPQAAQNDGQLIAEVGKLIDLPSEVPTIATVTDVARLKDQPFFQKAKNGDKVLIYSAAKKAILYNPNLKKIIDVAPLNIGTASAQPATPSANPRSSSVK